MGASASLASPHPWKLFASVSRLHIVAIACLGTFTFGWLFTGRYPWLLSGICALDWFLVNLLNRVVDLPEDRANGIVGTDFVSRHRRAILRLGFATLGLSFVATILVVPAITPFRLCYHACGFAYNWPLFPGRRRIKQLYFWKNTTSAIGFLLTLFCYPLAVAAWGGVSSEGLAPGISALTVLSTALFFFLFELSYEVIYDLRDATGDKLAGALTYPVVHGEAGARRIIDGLLFSSMAVLLASYLAGALPWRIMIMVAAPLLQLALYKRAIAKGGITSAHCIGFTWLGAGLLFTYHLWILAGLPGVGGLSMILLELSCLGIIGLYLGMALRRDPAPGLLLRRLLLLAAAGFLGEDSVIHAYGFYGYSPSWSVFLDQVPLLIVLIWPVVIHSAWVLSRRLLKEGHRAIPLAVFAFVLADASLIEPISVQAGLWYWTEPGFLAVPPIGILGWAFFASACVALFERSDRGGSSLLGDLGVIFLAPPVSHALLVASWWGALRWVNGVLPPWPVVALAWGVLFSFGLLAWRGGYRLQIPLPDILIRVPAAAFFFVLLALYGREVSPLVAYALAFVPPYLALIPWSLPARASAGVGEAR